MGEIISNEEPLTKDYLPEEVLFRENELRMLKELIKLGANVFIYGPPGSGKTLLVKKALEGISQTTTFYLDCSLYQTVNAILREILWDKLVFSRSNYDLLKKLSEKARKTKFIACLDNAEELKELDAIEKLMAVGLTVIVVAQKKEVYEALHPRARNMITEVLELKPYTQEQIFEILRKRAYQSLSSRSFSEELLERIAARSKGNASLAINVLRTCALRAELRGDRMISEELVNTVINQLDCPARLNDDERLLLEILSKNKRMKAGQLYELYYSLATQPKEERTFRKYMRRLCTLGLVRARGEKRGRIYEIL